MIEKILGLRFMDSTLERFELGRVDEFEMQSYGATNYYSCPEKGVEVNVDKDSDLIKQIFLYGPEGGAKGFNGVLPSGLDFTMLKNNVRAELGSPDMSFEAVSDPLIGEELESDRYNKEGYELHLSYHESGALYMISLVLSI